MKSRLFVIACLFLSQELFAEKFKGYVWDVSDLALVVEGVPVALTEKVRFERSNQKDVTVRDLRIGLEVEVEGRRGQNAFLAEKIKIKNKRFEEVDVEGFIGRVEGSEIEIGARRVLLPRELVPAEPLRAGMQIDGKGIVQDDGSIQVKKARFKPAGFDPEEAQFMALVSQEVTQMKEKLPRLDDPALQEYVARVGRGLVPDWANPEEIQFNFSVIQDDSLNAFALPDGTVVVHTGLLKVLDNEAQFATVLGHEIAHATNRHGYRGYKHQSKMMWVQLAAIAGGVVVGTKTDSPLAGILTSVGSSLTLSAIVNGHGRDLEDEADRVGLEYMVDAGYDPFQAPQVWKVFNQHSGDQSAVTNFFFSDHSTHRARISNLTREINTRYRGKIDPASTKDNRDQYQEAIAGLKASAESR
jgi:Zn-dependent protease with chaperone function